METAPLNRWTGVRVTRGRLPWATLGIAGLAIVVEMWPGADAALELNRESAREWWRWWTAHLVHFGGSHLGWNLAIFLPAGTWAERLMPRRTGLFYAVAPPAIAGVLLGLDPALWNYGGLSGVAAGALALLAWEKLSGSEGGSRWIWRAVLGLLALKIAGDAVFDRPSLVDFADASVEPVPLAHVAGVLVAAVVYVLPRFRRSGRV